MLWHQHHHHQQRPNVSAPVQQGHVITILDLIFHSRAFQCPPRLTVRAYSVVATPTPRAQISAEYIRQAPTFKHPNYKRLLLAKGRRQQEVRGNLPLRREILFCKRCLLSTDALSPGPPSGGYSQYTCKGPGGPQGPHSLLLPGGPHELSVRPWACRIYSA